MSCVAIFNESIPHVWATFITHLIAAQWSAFQLWSTHTFKAEYSRLIMGVNDPNGYLGLLGGPGACDGQDMLLSYFKPRMDAELITAILNFISVFGSGYLAYRLVHVFGWSTFKHIGASVVINRIYKLALTLTILIQLALFYIVTSVVRSLAIHFDCSKIHSLGTMDRPTVFVSSSLSALSTSFSWLSSGLFGPDAALLELQKAWQIVILVALIPWLTLGWFSVRREWRHGMLVFNSLSAFFLVSWLGMYLSACSGWKLTDFTVVLFSDSWRLTFMHWRFFSIIQVGAFTSCLLTFLLGILCRIFCFGRGLPQYLNPPSDDRAHDFKPAPDVQWDAEKVQFPDSRDTIPQFTKPPQHVLSKSPSALLPSNETPFADPLPFAVRPFPPVPPPADISHDQPLAENPFTDRSRVDPHTTDEPGVRHDPFDTATVERDSSFSTLYAGYTVSSEQSVQRSHGTIASFMTLHAQGIQHGRESHLSDMSFQAPSHGKPKDWTIE
jgi:hypothetical protein